MPSIVYPSALPVSQRREEILAALRSHQVVVIAGETGSGKTTQLPKMCVEAGFAEHGVIGCTQPRRVAAMSVSKRVAEELNVPWGKEVGCKMRFSDDTSRETRVKFMTDGILLAELQSDPMLRAYSCLIIDEAHERSLNIDFLLGCLHNLIKRRKDMHVIITSATIDTQAFSQHFGGAPVIEVSGRLFEVAVRYQPVESFASHEDDDVDIIEAAARAAEEALMEFRDGDVLVFMPTERDIRDCAELLEGRLGSGFEILTLFGRQAMSDQQRIFSPGRKQRVIISTNIAETSLTLPRIRCVVDSGLVRMSRYAARTRTKRLPVEAISQSSARQRAGRAGRVQDGVCVRLYGEEELAKRPAFTQPEIQRANLAEVILRMKAFRLGDIETFPFINPPLPAAMRAGYDLLHELGALDETEQLTRMGKDLASLPVDPTLGRMLLQAREEGVLAEVLIIASGLSIPDPRERPENEREKAAAAHRAFSVPQSDFMGLLKLWQSLPPDNRSSRNALRRFCRQNYLSFLRIIEWRDLHRQLDEAVADLGKRPTHPDARMTKEDAIHRSILAGLIGQIATKQEKNIYKATGNRMTTIFPGSVLFERGEKRRSPRLPAREDKDKAAEKSNQPLWIVAGEIVQTSQLFARTVARIDPHWVLPLAPHLCEERYSEPRYDAKSGRVLVTRRVLLHGLEIIRSAVDGGKVDAKAATALFIRSVLTNDGDAAVDEKGEPIPPPIGLPPFVSANQRLADRLRAAMARSPVGRVMAIDEALYDFYTQRLQGVSSLHDLQRVVKVKAAAGEIDAFLATENDLLGTHEDDEAAAAALAAFPHQVQLGNSVLPLDYRYDPGHEADGVTVHVPAEVAAHITSGQIQWLVPGLREEIISVLLRALPKAQRRELLPYEHKIKETAQTFDPGRDEFLPALAAFLSIRYKVPIKASDWSSDCLPTHLKPRISVLGAKKQPLAASRELHEIKAVVKEVPSGPSAAWQSAMKHWEHYELDAAQGWPCGEIPDKILIEEIGGNPVYAWPGFMLRDGAVDLRLFRSAAEAESHSLPAFQQLAERALGKDLPWIQRELRSLTLDQGNSSAQKSKSLSFNDALSALSVRTTAPAQKAATSGKSGPSSSSVTAWNNETLQTTALQHLLQGTLRLKPLFPLNAERFAAFIAHAKKELPLRQQRLHSHISQILEGRRKVMALTKRPPGLDTHLAALLPPDFLLHTPADELPHFPRFLKAMLVRQERWLVNPAKDAEKSAIIAEFDGWETQVPAANRSLFRFLLEEYKVQLFAQELGTGGRKVSVKRLEELME